MGLILFLLIGLAAGWLAGKIMQSERGLLANLGIGVAGAFIGGFLGRLLGLAATGLLGSLIVATLGAVIFLWVLSRLR
ncbi:MAG: GlsB/YeaQ/YmgE family stress response membrane protein [Silicimonas sp.]|nr:GlsB/YeaQ/YmgE family stress response membrane protein [Silicimonas sp.]